MGEISFIYDGTSAIQDIKFSPQYATQEAGTRGYYLDLFKDGKYLWSLGNFASEADSHTLTPISGERQLSFGELDFFKETEKKS